MRYAGLLSLVTLVAASDVLAQGPFDGTWRGTAGDWTVTLAVNGTKAKLNLKCFGNTWDFDIPVGADGAIDTYVRAPDMARRQVTGRLPEFNVPPGGTCRGATATLSK